MSEVVESFYLYERYRVDWEAVDKAFDEMINKTIKEARAAGKLKGYLGERK